MHTRFLIAPFILVLALLSTVAGAQVRIEAQASNLQFTLRDLDVRDTLAPSIVLGAVDMPLLMADTMAWRQEEIGSPFHQDHDSLWNADGESRLVLRYASYVDALAVAGGGQAMDTVHGSVALDLRSPPLGTVLFGRAESFPGTFHFQLAPLSSVTFTVDITLAMHAVAPLPGMWLRADTSAGLYAGSARFPEAYDPVSDGVALALGYRYDELFLPEQAISRTLSVTLDNPAADAWKTGEVQFGLGASGSIEVSPVPEPASSAIWLAGALVAGLALRRSRRSMQDSA